jgi:hypothetical protein
LEVSEAKRLKALEDENGRLKRMLADAMLDGRLRGMKSSPRRRYPSAGFGFSKPTFVGTGRSTALR